MKGDKSHECACRWGEEADTKIALAGVNRTGLGSCVFVSAPRSKQHANGKMVLIEDRISLPPLLQLRSKSFLERLYLRDHLSVNEVARMTKISHSTVLAALSRFDIPQTGNGHKQPGQIPFGFEYADYQLVKSKAEQEVVRMIRQYRAGGLSLRQIAGQLNQYLIPTKNGGIWQANTVRKILARV
jgi:DNA-binding CsgD family transcriptional regulator